MGQPRPLFCLFWVFFKQTSLQFLQQIYVKKIPSNIWCRDSNPWPSECESQPITTRPGLSPFLLYLRHRTWNKEEFGSPGLVVMGRDSCNDGCGFESQLYILNGLFHIHFVKFVMFVWKDENKLKRDCE